MQVSRIVGMSLLLGLLIACGVSGAEPGSIIDHTLWEYVPLEDDPFKDYAPSEVLCPVSGYEVEGEGEDKILEVDTSICNFITLEQPLARALRAGDILEWSMWHLTLVFTEPAEAYVALTIGDHLIWEQTMPIPSPAAAYSRELDVPADIPQGAPIRIHLHNHGNNSWRFHRLAVSD